MLGKKVAEYNGGNKKAMSDILALKKKEIFDLLNDGMSIKTIKEILENELNVQIKSDTFYKFVQRQKAKQVVQNEPIKKDKKTSSTVDEIKQKTEVKNVAPKEPKKTKDKKVFMHNPRANPDELF